MDKKLQINLQKFLNTLPLLWMEMDAGQKVKG